MKNQTLIPVLLPTDDASPLFINSIDNKLAIDYELADLNSGANQHLYLCSDAPIKEGDWVMSHPDTHTQKDAEGKSFSPFGKVEIISEQGVKLVEPDGHWYWTNLDCKKIEFTTDPRLIADGVPAIDGNTKARVSSGISSIRKEVNFLEEFCKRWNEKNHKGLDLDKISSKASELISKITKKDYEDFVKKDNQKVDVEKLANDYQYKKGLDNKGRIAFRDGYNQALQSKAGFSLEDMRKTIELLKESAHRFNRAAYDENASIYDDYAKEINKFIQSLTKETPKGLRDTIVDAIDGFMGEIDKLAGFKGDIIIELNEGKLIFW